MCDRMHACMCACGACQNETDHFKNLQTRFTPCCGLLRMYNCIKLHYKTASFKTMNSYCGSCKIKTDHFGKPYTHVLFDKKKQEYKSFARELDWNTQLL